MPKLKKIKSWGYQLQKAQPDVIAATKYDVVVIDYSRDGTDEGTFRAEEIARMKKKPDGSRRIVLAYLSIGEAEDYRYYWRKKWGAKPPAWLLPENPDWPGNYRVKFWHKRWQKIIHGYLEKILAAGFDGVYLDRIDSFEEFPKVAAAEKRMISFVRNIARRTNRGGRKFLIVPQNAENLLRRKRYRAVLSAIAKEDLLFGVKGDRKANDKDMIFWSKKYLLQARKKGLPVLIIEYLDDRKTRKEAAAKLRSFGFIPTFSNRKLDRLSLPHR